MESSLFALILTICVVILVACVCYYCNNSKHFLEKSYVISNVFNTDKETDPDIDLIIVEDKPKDINIIDKVVGNINKIDFYVKKNNGSFQINIPSYNNYSFGGKGLVIAANGIKYRYITGVYMNIYVIRNLYKSDIPVEIMYVGEDEAFNNKMKNKLLTLGNIKLINLTERLNTNISEDRLIGYRTKPLAVIASSFEEIVLMDADALSFIDPYYFFGLDGYVNNGMVLFKDYVPCLHYIDKNFINNIGIGSKNYCKKTGGFELDSSCVVVNKERAWEALYAICIINVESDSYYSNKKRNVLGDKDTWLIGSMFVGFDPYISEADPGLLLSFEKDGMKVVYGHLQSQKSTNFVDYSYKEGGRNIPLYYNNQAIDLSVYDGMENWGYLEDGVKNPKMLQSWNKPYIKITEKMKKTFAVASHGLNDILNIINITRPPNTNNMVVKNLIQ